MDADERLNFLKFAWDHPAPICPSIEDVEDIRLHLEKVSQIALITRAPWYAAIAERVAPDVYAEFDRLRHAHDDDSGDARTKDARDGQFYDFIARESLSGPVHSSKYPQILDSAVLLGTLIKRLEISGRFLDLGCHTGHHAFCLATTSELSGTGVDVSEQAVGYARDKARRLRLPVEFHHTDITTSLPHEPVQLIYAIDAYKTARQVRMDLIANLLTPGGVFVLVQGNSVIRGREQIKPLLKSAEKHGLTLGLHLITGGWNGEDWPGSQTLVLVKAQGRNFPFDVEKRTERLWREFQRYANRPAIRPRERNHSYFRAKTFEEVSSA